MIPMVAAGRGPAQTAVRVLSKQENRLAAYRRSVDLIAVAIVIALLYAPAAGFALVFDDHSLLGGAGKPLWLGGSLLPYRPLRYLSLSLDAQFVAWLGACGLHVSAPAVYHATNIALHLLAFVLLCRLAQTWGARRAPALLAAALFALHPLAVESVAYVAGRRDLLALICVLASLLAWTCERRRPLAALLLGCAAAMAKESGLLVFALLPLADRRSEGRDLRAGGLLAWLAASVVAAASLVAYGARGPLLPAGSLAGTLLMAPALAAHYAKNVLWPAALSVEYPALRDAAFWQGASLAARGLGAGLLLAAAARALGALTGSRRMRAGAGSTSPLAFVWPAVALASIALVIGGHEPGADRHAYPLLASFAVALAVAVTRLAAPWRGAALAAMSAASLALALASSARLPVWQNDLTLWRATVRAAPQSPRAHYNFAAALAERGRPGRARRQLRAALAVDPGYGWAQLGLASLDCDAGRFDAAGEALARAGRQGAAADDVAQLARVCDQLQRTPRAAASERRTAREARVQESL